MTSVVAAFLGLGLFCVLRRPGSLRCSVTYKSISPDPPCNPTYWPPGFTSGLFTSSKVPPQELGSRPQHMPGRHPSAQSELWHLFSPLPSLFDSVIVVAHNQTHLPCKFSLHLFTYFIYVYLHVHVCHRAHVEEVRGQFAGIGSFLLPCVSQGSNLGH